METRLAESIPSLRNLRPIPGPSGDLLSAVGAAAEDSLMSPLSAPLKIPVYGLDMASNLTLPTAPTEWIYFLLFPYNYPGGIESPGAAKLGSIDSRKIPASSAVLGKDPCVVSDWISLQRSVNFASADLARYSFDQKYLFGVASRPSGLKKSGDGVTSTNDWESCENIFEFDFPIKYIL